MTGLVLLYRGYSQDIKQVYGDRDDATGGGGRFGQWLFAVFCLFWGRIVWIGGDIHANHHSSTVLDVLLNFAAVKFVAGLEEAVFELCGMGFLGRANRIEAVLVNDSTYHIPTRTQP